MEGATGDMVLILLMSEFCLESVLAFRISATANGQRKRCKNPKR
jgi:hypothetical protein